MHDAEYRKLAEVEDQMWYFHSIHLHMLDGLREVLSLDREASLLDAGCGTGGLIRRLSAQNSRWVWTGIDLSPQACALARNRCTAKIVQGSVEALPFASESFDGIVSADVLYHVAGDEKALVEFLRVLRPGGVLVVNVPAYQWLWSYHDEAVHSLRRYACGEVLEKLRRAGFVGARGTYWNTLLFPLIVARRKFLPAPKGGSDVQLSSVIGEKVLRAVSQWERCWLRRIGRLPFGSSVCAVAQKPSVNG